MWETILFVVAGIILVCFTATTFKLLIFGYDKSFRNEFVDGMTDGKWGAALLLFIPWFLGDYGRGQSSPLPWKAFQIAYDKHGVVDGIISCLMCITVDLWMLWLPGALYLESHRDVDKRTRILVRTVNLSIGLLLMTPHNPIYWLIDALPRPTPDE